MGDVHHNELTNQLEVGVLRSVGSTTGAMDGPSLNYVVDLNRGTCYQFTYLENNEVYDNSRAMFVINSIDFWDYIPEE